MSEQSKRQATFCSIVVILMLMAGNAFASSVILSDQFTGTSLNPQWEVMNGQGTYSVNNGLTYTGDGPLSSPSGWLTKSTTLALPFQGEHWEADISLSYSLKWLLSGNYSYPCRCN